MVPQRQFGAGDVLAVLADLFIEAWPTGIFRQRSEFAAGAIREWFARLGVKTLFIEPGSPWENGYIGSFNARLRNELLDGEIFYTVDEARVITGCWREHYNKLRPHVHRYRGPDEDFAEQLHHHKDQFYRSVTADCRALSTGRSAYLANAPSLSRVRV
jgi:putative transposase